MWNTDKSKSTPDAIQPHRMVAVVVTARSLYFQSKGLGLTLECQHIIVRDDAPTCPWDDE